MSVKEAVLVITHAKIIKKENVGTSVLPSRNTKVSIENTNNIIGTRMGKHTRNILRINKCKRRKAMNKK